ncbi:MAG: trigger factor [Chloroflexi bacterium]|nr:trigger factor [Chloroflexota bacterium]
MVKVTNDKTENSQVFLTIEMAPAEVEESLEKAYYRLVQRTRIPGFRKGKAPRAILERHIGKESLFEEALNNLVPQAYEQAVKEQEIEAIAQPRIEIAQTDPVIFKAIVSLKPKVTLGDYQHIRVTPEPVAVTDSDVDAVIEQLRHQQATWEPVERPVDFGDLIVLDIESDTAGKPFINQKGAQYQVLHDLSFPVPGFAEQLAGMKKDEEKEFKLQFPSDDPRDELAGKEASFKARVSEVKQEVLPELSDEFAREVNPDFKSVDSRRERVASDLKLRAEEKARIDFEERVIDAVVELSQVEFPPILVEAEVHRILDQRFQRGNQALEEYLRSINKTEEELHEELHPLATRRVTRSLVLAKVVEEAKVEVSDSEIDIEIGNMTKNATENKDKLEKLLNTPQARESIKQTLIARKAIQLLAEIAKEVKEIKTLQKEAQK